MGFLVDVCHRLPLKNQVFFSPPPLFEGGRGGFAFHHTPKRPQKKSPLRFPRAVHFSTDVAVKKVGRTTLPTLPGFPHESKSPPPTPLQKGGAYLGFLVDVCHRLLLKKSGAFSHPFFEGGLGGICFSSHHQTPIKKPPLRFHKDGLFSTASIEIEQNRCPLYWITS